MRVLAILRAFWQPLRMWRIVLAYGAGLAVIALLIEYLQYRHIIRSLPTEGYIAALAIVFVGIGLWVGMRINPSPATTPFEPNERAIASLGVTPREYAVLELLARGHSNKEIARVMEISPNTVKTHVANLYAKLGVSGRGKAVEAARALALIA